jgi:hypothetical protein
MSTSELSIFNNLLSNIRPTLISVDKNSMQKSVFCGI